MRCSRYVIVTLCAVAVLAGASPAVAAATFPERPVNLVVAFAAGGPTDTIVRALQEKLADKLGQPAIVQNKPGSGGLVAAEFVAKSKADGYNILVLSLSHLLRQAIDPQMGIDILKDFESITTYVSLPIVFVTRSDSQFRTIDDLIAYGLKNPGRLAFGHSGIGATSHLSGELFRLHTKIQLKFVPFAGEAPTMTAIMGGHVDFGGFGGPTPRGKDVRVLAALEEKRISYFPDVPTFVEKGYRQIVMPSWYGFAVPAGTPKDVVAKLHEALKAAIKDPATQANIERLGFNEIYRTPEETRAFVRAEFERFKELTSAAGIVVK
jgi:tripartite-type tricarboxylate transporter receptor subunit TctC